MALPLAIHECETLTKAFSGIGVDEKIIISTLGKWHPAQRQSYRKTCPKIFKEDDRQFERWENDHIKILKFEFSRFKKAVVLRAMNPWERDARLAKKAMNKGHRFGLLIEISCARTSEELLGARKAYHSLYHHSLEEDVAYSLNENKLFPENTRDLLVALVSSYRFEGTRVDEKIAKSEAKTLGHAIKDASLKKPIDNYEVKRILSTRSKPQLQATFSYYKEMFGGSIDEDLKNDESLQATVQCLCFPSKYFSKVLELALKGDANDNAKEALTRVVITRADIDIKEIKEAYHKQYGVSLEDKIEKATNGNYKELLLTLVGKGGK